jgi:hypothetical protein
MRRYVLLLLSAALGGLLTVVPSSPAGAHAYFNGVTSVPANAQRTLVMIVPHELEDGIYNTKVEIAVPNAWQVQGCTAQATWSCSSANDGAFRVITWTKGAGQPPAGDEAFEFRVRSASSAGTWAFPTIQTYSDGTEAAWIGEPDAPEPAPRLQTTPAGATTTRPPATPPPHGSPGPQPTAPNGPGPTTPSPGPSQPSPTAPGATTTTTEPGDTSTTTDTTEPSDRSTTSETTDRDDRDDDDGTTTTDGSDDGSSEEATAGTRDPDDGGGGSGALVAILVVVLLAAAGGAGFYIYRRAQTPA